MTKRDDRARVAEVQKVADDLHGAGADLAVVIILRDGAMYTGARVPSEEVFILLLQRTIESVRDLTKPREGAS
jgi:hypothetical protein